jgi:hypothetical protein
LFGFIFVLNKLQTYIINKQTVPWSELMSFSEVVLDASLIIFCLVSVVVSLRSVSRSFLLYQVKQNKANITTSKTQIGIK